MIETPRLRIRPLEAGDAAALFAVWRDPANERFGFGMDPPASVEETRAWIGQGTPPWGVWEKESGALVGDCGLFPEGDEWELAYGFRRDRWGRGYATEAAGACVRYGFEELGLERVVADIHPDGHPASPRVLAKLGFREWRVEAGKVVYVLTRSGAAPPPGGDAPADSRT